MFFKLFVLLAFLFFRQVFSNLESEILNLEKNFNQGNFNDVLVEGEALKRDNFNNLAIREILLKVYLEKNFLNRAKMELAFIERWSSGDRVNYLAALVAFYEKKYALALDTLNDLLMQNALYQDAYLLKAKISTEQGKYILANENLNEYESVAGKTLEWYELRGTLILKELPMDLAVLRDHLDEFRNLYPGSSDFFFLESQFYLLSKAPRKALNSINKAISLRENYFPYVKKKLEIYFLYKNWRPLLVYLKKQSAINDGEFAYYKKLEAFVQLLVYKLEDSPFGLKIKIT